MTPLVYGSVCSGIEAASVAWGPLGWRPAWFAETAPFPSAVLAHRYPETPNRGDFTQIDESEPIDLLVGGTPCQSFSVAGVRAGLRDDRGNLALEFLRLAGRLRPRWVVWENVPGVLSSNGGRDFGTFVGGLAELGYGWAYRVLDAQYCRVDGFGRAVPQRRRRIYVVGYLGDWRRATAVLFDRDILQGSDPPSETVREDIADCLEASIGGRSGKPQHANRRGQLVIFLESSSRLTRILPHLRSGTRTSCESRESARWLIRRLTPRECERLQGFPDDWTLVPYRGRLATNGVRYTAIGNSMPVNVMRWLGRRIELVEEITHGDICISGTRFGQRRG